MGKSSSSSKKIKRSKDSSKLRSVKKKNTKRNKSKKIRRLKDYSDDSESSGSDSSLYSSSEDDYRRRKRRSKVSKKRSRKRYSSSESDDADDDTRLLKKKKRSKKKDEQAGKTKKKKKTGSRKRRKRDLSSSSTSSVESGSIQGSDDSSKSGSESDGKRKIRDRGRLGKVKAVHRRSKEESEENSEEPDQCWKVEDDEGMSKKNSRRLKSIIVVSYAYDDDQRKEEMVDDHDVYPTRGGNRELGHNEDSDERDGETYPTIGSDDSGRKTVGYDDFREEINAETSKASHLDNSMKDEDLEAILKKRALENLKRFRGEIQRNEIARKKVSAVAAVGSQDHGLMEQELCVSAGSKDLETSQKILGVVNNVKESGTVASPQDQQPGDTAKVKGSSGISSCTTKRKLIRPELGQEILNPASGKEATGSQNVEAESINGSAIDKNCPESSQSLATKNGGENIESKVVSSTLNEQSFSRETLDETKEGSQSEQKTLDETKEGSQSETTDETNDGSQYEQKTMTVMRGGELVQVSYKVYIPKKTSALGRRRLKR